LFHTLWNDFSTIASYRLIAIIEIKIMLWYLERSIRPYEVESIFIKLFGLLIADLKAAKN